ncbi:MAG: methyltransferase domain-containing protein, partial [Comamonadaceae bacterium]
AFTTTTPETQRRVLRNRAVRIATDVRDAFGWNLPFTAALLPADVQRELDRAGAIEQLGDGLMRSRVRFATIRGIPYVHSAFPTQSADAVFCGPDTYRFIDLIERTLAAVGGRTIARAVDIGCGAGAGGLVAGRWLARTHGQAPRLQLVDINPKALDMARVNAAAFGLANVEFAVSDLYRAVQPGVDLIVANPPYLVDDGQRLYRHGGGALGAGLSERIVAEGLPLLAPGGRLVLYTGSAITQGQDLFREAVLARIDPARFAASYVELDPDVFGEELDRPAYRDVERIAAVALVVTA